MEIRHKLYLGDCVKILNTLEKKSIDLVVTSPPYNVNLGFNKYNSSSYDVYSDNKEHEEYILWLKKIFCIIYKKLKKGGRVCINIGDGKNGACPTHSDIIQFMVKEIGYIPYSVIIWNKSQIGNRTSWGSWKSPSCPSFPTTFEYILIFAKKTKKLRGIGETDLSEKEFIDWSLAVWNIAPETKMKEYGHPAMFPLELPIRLIKMLSWKGAVVLDPFNGAGTTGVACKLLGRSYIGIELSETYYNISLSRFKKTDKILRRQKYRLFP